MYIYGSYNKTDTIYISMIVIKHVSDPKSIAGMPNDYF